MPDPIIPEELNWDEQPAEARRLLVAGAQIQADVNQRRAVGGLLREWEQVRFEEIVHPAPPKKKPVAKQEPAVDTFYCRWCRAAAALADQLKTKDGYEICSSHFRQIASCKYCGDLALPEKFEAGNPIVKGCSCALSEDKNKLRVPQKNEFTPKSSILRSRKEVAWPKISA